MIQEERFHVWVGEQFEALRKSRKWSLADVGERVNISRKQIMNYEYGRNTMPATTLVELCELFGLDYYKFIREAIEHSK